MGGSISSNPNNPSNYVLVGNSLSFNSKFSPSGDYILKIMVVPLILFGLGILFLFAFCISSCCCRCLRFCKCSIAKEKEYDINDPKYRKSFEMKRLYNMGLFYFLCVCALIFSIFILTGNQYTGQFSYGMIDFTKWLQHKGEDLNDLAGSLNSLLQQMLNIVVSIQQLHNDPNFDLYSSLLLTSSGLCTMIQNFSNSLINSAQNMQSFVQTYAVNLKNDIFYTVWALAILAIGVIMLVDFCKTKIGMRIAIVISSIIYFIYLILGFFWCITTTVLGTVCVTPLEVFTTSFPMSQNFNNVTHFFSTCTGSTWLVSDIKLVLVATTSIEDIFNEWYTKYPELDNQINGLYVSNQKVINTVLNIQNSTVGYDACQFIKNALIKADETQICGNLYYGFYSIWGGQLMCTIMIFLLLIVATYRYKYFYDPLPPIDDEKRYDLESYKQEVIQTDKVNEDSELLPNTTSLPNDIIDDSNSIQAIYNEGYKNSEKNIEYKNL